MGTISDSSGWAATHLPKTSFGIMHDSRGSTDEDRMKHSAVFLDCLHKRRLMEVSYRSKKHGESVITRTCAPWDIGPFSRARDRSVEYYWVMDLTSPSGVHLTRISEQRLVAAAALDATFDPAEVSSQDIEHIHFYVARDW